MNRRPLTHRLIDRLWTVLTRRLEDDLPPTAAVASEALDSSISGTMAWPLACDALASGRWTSEGFRRRRSVREVVETLAPCDGRYFANWIAARNRRWFESPEFLMMNDWGDPIQVPGFLMGTPRRFSPTSLRYLAHALWMVENGIVIPGETVVEIGVGFGGLAAMNRIVGNAPTHMVDLPPVVEAARTMLFETGTPAP